MPNPKWTKYSLNIYSLRGIFSSSHYVARYLINVLDPDLILDLRMADPKREALLCRTSAFGSWLCCCLSGPAGESLLSLLLFKKWIMVFLLSHLWLLTSALTCCLFTCVMPTTACPSLHVILVIAPIKKLSFWGMLLHMRNCSPEKRLGFQNQALESLDVQPGWYRFLWS